jgi:hypothetical protein
MSIASRPHPAKSTPPIPLGSEFDVTFDMADGSPAPAKPPVPFGANTFSATQPTSTRAVRRGLLKSQETGPLVGSNAAEVHQIDIVRARQSQAPVAMERLASQGAVSIRSGTARSQHSAHPNVRPKMYVFGYREEAEYIPRPFVSSHRPKVPRDRAGSARAGRSSRARFTFEKPAKLSKRREVVNPDFCDSIVVGSFHQFEQSYRRP